MADAKLYRNVDGHPNILCTPNLDYATMRAALAAAAKTDGFKAALTQV